MQNEPQSPVFQNFNNFSKVQSQQSIVLDFKKVVKKTRDLPFHVTLTIIYCLRASNLRYSSVPEAAFDNLITVATFLRWARFFTESHQRMIKYFFHFTLYTENKF